MVNWNYLKRELLVHCKRLSQARDTNLPKRQGAEDNTVAFYHQIILLFFFCIIKAFDKKKCNFE